MYTLSKQFSDKFNEQYVTSIKHNEIDNDEYNKLVKVYEDYERNRKLNDFFKLKLVVFSKNIIFSYNKIAFDLQ